MLDRREVVAALLKDRKNLVVISGLGSSTYDVAAAGDHDRNFYLWGAMGGAAATGLGLAIARPDTPVLVVTGDGEMLMALGSFATIALQNPLNLTLVVLDNKQYGETGGQATHSARGTNLAEVAKACGIENAREIGTMDDVISFSKEIHSPRRTLMMASIGIRQHMPTRVMTPRSGAVLVERTRKSFGLAPI